MVFPLKTQPVSLVILYQLSDISKEKQVSLEGEVHEQTGFEEVVMYVNRSCENKEKRRMLTENRKDDLTVN